MKNLLVTLFSSLIICLFGMTNTGSAYDLHFTNIGSTPGLNILSDTAGAPVVDFDNDGIEDIALKGWTVISLAILLIHSDGEGNFTDDCANWENFIPASNFQAQPSAAAGEPALTFPPGSLMFPMYMF